MTIFGVAVVAFVQSMGDSVSIQTDLLNRARAAALAENILEEIRMSGDLEPNVAEGDFDGTDAAYHWESEISETDRELLRNVRVRISWMDGGAARDYSLTTLMAAR